MKNVAWAVKMLRRPNPAQWLHLRPCGAQWSELWSDRTLFSTKAHAAKYRRRLRREYSYKIRVVRVSRTVTQ